MTRCESLRTNHGWTRQQMAEFLNCSVWSIARLEGRSDGKEPGGYKRLLDMLETNPSLMPVPAPKASPAAEPAA